MPDLLPGYRAWRWCGASGVPSHILSGVSQWSCRTLGRAGCGLPLQRPAVQLRDETIGTGNKSGKVRKSVDFSSVFFQSSFSYLQLVSPAVFEKHQQKSLKEVQATSKNSFHCKTPDCNGWCFISDNINSFKCPLCKRLNCITCQV